MEVQSLFNGCTRHGLGYKSLSHFRILSILCYKILSQSLPYIHITNSILTNPFPINKNLNLTLFNSIRTTFHSWDFISPMLIRWCFKLMCEIYSQQPTFLFLSQRPSGTKKKKKWFIGILQPTLKIRSDQGYLFLRKKGKKQ